MLRFHPFLLLDFVFSAAPETGRQLMIDWLHFGSPLSRCQQRKLVEVRCNRCRFVVSETMAYRSHLRGFAIASPKHLHLYFYVVLVLAANIRNGRTLSGSIGSVT